MYRKKVSSNKAVVILTIYLPKIVEIASVPSKFFIIWSYIGLM